MAIHLHGKSHVGTTYKRALPRKNPGRDEGVSACLSDPEAIRGEQHYVGSITLWMETLMRKPKDYDSELKALADKAKALKDRRVRQLGDLITATGADTLDADILAGALLSVAEMKDSATKEGWRKRGAAFFQGKTRGAPVSTNRNTGRLPQSDSSTPSA